ncbi:MAG: sugar phosphate isomerase/epimerase [Clostridiales bacterium]|nr:sugar phosphate isomerase/epimerase [Clostridiales bacterium]
MKTNLPIAVQLYSVRDAMAADFEGTLKQIKEMGYDGVEFAGLFGKDPAYIKALCAELGLVPISAHVAYAEMMADIEGTMSAYETIGCKFIVIPYMTEEYRPDGAEFDKACEDMKILGKAAKDHGLTLLYHNHDFEFVKLGDEYGIDVMYNRVPACLLQTELDTCWVNVAGENPANFVLKYSGRAPVVHLKDFHMPAVKPEKMYALIGIDDGEAEEEKGEDDVFGFRPVGYGMQDVPAIIAASEKAGASWLVVEQDNPSMGKTPLECVKMSIEYLRA